MHSPLHAVMIYAKDMQKTAAFYQHFFGLASRGMVDGLIELNSPDGAAVILIHQAAKSMKFGQIAVKMVFAVEDVEVFKARSAERGLVFGSTHQANGYAFANTKDPDKNSVLILKSHLYSLVYRGISMQALVP